MLPYGVDDGTLRGIWFGLFPKGFRVPFGLISGRSRIDILIDDGCLHFAGALIIRALYYLGVYIRARDFCKLPFLP